jgi:hypothetical protein
MPSLATVTLEAAGLPSIYFRISHRLIRSFTSVKEDRASTLLKKLL